MNTPQEFAPLLAGLRALPPVDSGAALVTLTRTRGATFRRAGARMLAYADGRILRGLSAGCPEQDIAARAREAIQTGDARLLRYDREHGYDTLLEMGCGGELEVLIEPLRGADDWAFAEQIDTLLEARGEGAMATLFARDGACLARPRRWLDSSSQQRDELQDPALTDRLREYLARPSATVPATARVIQLSDSRGRSAELLLERLSPPCAALLFGLNATALALAGVLAGLGWRVGIVDHAQASLPPSAPPVPLPAGVSHLHCAPSATEHGLHFDRRSFAVVMTHNLQRDIEYLQALRKAPLAYLGAVGARKRARQLQELMRDSLTPLRSPAGLDIGSETPEEIALAIAAEMLAAANGTSGLPLSSVESPIHR